MDGAWRASDNEGIVAWVLISQSQGSPHSSATMRFRASSTKYIEAKACLAAIQWAAQQGWMKIIIYTDYLNAG